LHFGKGILMFHVANDHSVSGHYEGAFDEPSIRVWAEGLRRQMGEQPISLGLVFMAPRFFEQAGQVLEILRVHARIPLLAGCSGQSLVNGGQEWEGNAGISLGLYSLPGADLHAFHITQEQVEEANGPGYWRLETGIESDHTNGWLAFLDPFQTDSESWLRGWNEAYSPVPIFGGLASGDHEAQSIQLYLNGDVFTAGGIAVSVGGTVGLRGVTSQGCTPIGEAWTVTKVEQNIIQQIGNLPAFEILARTFSTLSPDDQLKTRGNLFIGLVVNEYLEEFHRGDFLIRNLLGADPKTGYVAIGALPRMGQTIQFQRRSAAAASEDLEALIGRAKKDLADATIYGACLCSCNGRGQNLFGRPHHDAEMVQRLLGPLGLAGFFCNGEIGPVGQKSFLHGYTASLALFVSKS
jgi:small ligand-binding sensory domain FIST